MFIFNSLLLAAFFLFIALQLSIVPYFSEGYELFDLIQRSNVILVRIQKHDPRKFKDIVELKL